MGGAEVENSAARPILWPQTTSGAAMIALPSFLFDDPLIERCKKACLDTFQTLAETEQRFAEFRLVWQTVWQQKFASSAASLANTSPRFR